MPLTSVTGHQESRHSPTEPYAAPSAAGLMPQRFLETFLVFTAAEVIRLAVVVEFRRRVFGIHHHAAHGIAYPVFRRLRELRTVIGPRLAAGADEHGRKQRDYESEFHLSSLSHDGLNRFQFLARFRPAALRGQIAIPLQVLANLR